MSASVHAFDSSLAELPILPITANPIVDATAVDNFSALTTRVTEKQIRDLGAQSLPDALRMTPGVQISLYNAVGNYSGNQGGSVYVRGMGTSRPGSEIKTYLDGLPVYMGLWNHPLMDLLPLNGIGTIEVLKGPQPMQYGNTFAAINLETKKPSAKGIQGEVSTSVGAHDTHTLKANLLASNEKVDFSLAAGSADSQGYRVNGDASLNNALGKVTLHLNEVWSTGVSFLHVENHVGDPGDNRYAVSATPTGAYQSNGVGRNHSLSDRVTAFLVHEDEKQQGEIKIYRTTGKNDITNDANWGTFNSSFTLSGLRWKEQLRAWSGGTVVAGIDVDRVSGAMNGPHVGATVGTPFAFGIAGHADIPTFSVTSPYVGVSQAINLAGGWLMQPSIGFRAYQSNRYADQGAPYAGLSLSRDNLSIYANYSVGIVYPGAETYALTRALPMAFSANNGWDNLTAQKDKHTELGVKWDATNTTQFNISVFQDDVSDRYVWSGFTPFATSTWSNTASNYQVRGVEASVHQEIGANWVVFVGATTLNPSISTLPFMPGTALSVGTNGRIADFRVSVDAHHQTSMYSQSWDRSVTSTNEEVSAFTVANMRVAYPVASLGKKGEIFMGVNNVFNSDYEYNAGYPMQGRDYQLGVVASF